MGCVVYQVSVHGPIVLIPASISMGPCHGTMLYVYQDFMDGPKISYTNCHHYVSMCLSPCHG